MNKDVVVWVHIGLILKKSYLKKSYLKKDKLLQLVTIWVQVERIIVRKISQKEKSIYIYPYIYIHIYKSIYI